MGDEGRELFYLTAVEEADGTAGLSGLFFIVGHHYDGASVFFIQLMQQLHDFRTHLGVQITGRLIGEYYLRIADDGARNGNTLALTAGKLCRHVAHTVAQTHLLQYFLCQTATLLGRHLSVQLNEDNNRRLRSGLKTDVYVMNAVKEDVLRIANASYYVGRGEYELFVRNSDNEIVKRKVQLGDSNFEFVEVIGGLQPGDEVVVSDMSQYKNKNKLKLK